jgi:hypothetical protein
MPTVISGDGTITGLTATGISAVQQLPAGSVLQVVNATYGTQVNTSSSTYIDTGLTASITPKFATSKILIIASVNGLEKSSANANNSIALRLLQNSTTLSTFIRYALWTNSTFSLVGSSGCINYLDSPATTSSTTYKLQFANENNGAAVTINSTGSASFITLMEIAA